MGCFPLQMSGSLTRMQLARREGQHGCRRQVETAVRAGTAVTPVDQVLPPVLPFSIDVTVHSQGLFLKIAWKVVNGEEEKNQ